MPAKKPRNVILASKHKGLRVVRKSAVVGHSSDGSMFVREPEKTYEFHNGVLTLEPGQDVMVDEIDGRQVEQDAISFFRTNPQIREFFDEITHAAPDSKPELRKVAKLAARGDVDGLVALGDEESAEWAREDVLDAIRDALDAIEETKQPAKAAAK